MKEDVEEQLYSKKDREMLNDMKCVTKLTKDTESSKRLSSQRSHEELSDNFMNDRFIRQSPAVNKIKERLSQQVPNKSSIANNILAFENPENLYN